MASIGGWRGWALGYQCSWERGGYLYVCLFLGGHLCVFLGLRRFALGAPLGPRLGISLLLILGLGVPLGPRLDTSGPGEVGWPGWEGVTSLAGARGWGRG